MLLPLAWNCINLIKSLNYYRSRFDLTTFLLLLTLLWLAATEVNSDCVEVNPQDVHNLALLVLQAAHYELLELLFSQLIFP